MAVAKPLALCLLCWAELMRLCSKLRLSVFAQQESLSFKTLRCCKRWANILRFGPLQLQEQTQRCQGRACPCSSWPSATSWRKDGPCDHCCRNQKVTEQVVIGTHGKLKNWLSKRTLDVSAVKILVFDEADQMLEASTHRCKCSFLDH